MYDPAKLVARRSVLSAILIAAASCCGCGYSSDTPIQDTDVSSNRAKNLADVKARTVKTKGNPAPNAKTPPGRR